MYLEVVIIKLFLAETSIKPLNGMLFTYLFLISYWPVHHLLYYIDE